MHPGRRLGIAHRVYNLGFEDVRLVQWKVLVSIYLKDTTPIYCSKVSHYASLVHFLLRFWVLFLPRTLYFFLPRLYPAIIISEVGDDAKSESNPAASVDISCFPSRNIKEHHSRSFPMVLNIQSKIFRLFKLHHRPTLQPNHITISLSPPPKLCNRRQKILKLIISLQLTLHNQISVGMEKEREI